MTFKKYELSDDKLIKIARLCVQEQGCIKGVKAEASQGANLLETNAKYRNKFKSDIYKFFRDSKWYANAPYYMDNGYASPGAIDVVKSVLCFGDRLYPQYVDEHDCISDISYIELHGEKVDKRNTDNYKRGQTIIVNRYGSVYTFYDFPDKGCDPFGYTIDAYNYVMGNSNPKHVEVSVKLPILKRGSENDYVRLWQTIVGTSPDGIFGTKTRNATIKLQESHRLDGDGIVGANTWKIGLENLNPL